MHDRRAGRPRRPAALHRPRAGAGRPGALPRRQARHRPADRERLLLRLRRRRARSPPRTSRRSRPGCARSSRRARRFSRREVTDDEARAELADEPYKLELIGLKGRPADDAAEGASVEVGAGELTIYDNLRRNGDLAWKDLCRGPHLPTTKRIPAFKLMRSRGRVLARRREEPAAAARLRHRVADQGRAARRTSSGIAEAERRDHRKLGTRARPVLLPRRDRLRAGGVPPQGRRHQAGDGGLRPPPAHRGGLLVRRHPAHHQGAACSRPRATCRTTPTACSRR